MSKAPKKASPDSRANQSPPKIAHAKKSVLAAAWNALEGGDVLTARTLAQEVIAGKKGPDDDRVAFELAREMTAADGSVGELPEQVAQSIVNRTTVPSRAYVYGAICFAVFLALFGLARTRYG
jgi:hypothetical protein